MNSHTHTANTPDGSDNIETKDDEMEENREEFAPNGESGTDSSNKLKERDDDNDEQDDDEQDAEGGSNSNPGSNDGTAPTYEWFLNLYYKKRELFDAINRDAPIGRTGQGPTADDENCKACTRRLGDFEDRDKILGPYSGNPTKTYNALWKNATARLFWGYATGQMGGSQPKNNKLAKRVRDFEKANDHDDYPSENECKCFDFIMENLNLTSLEKDMLLDTANAAWFETNIKTWARDKKDVSDRVKVITRDLLVGLDLIGFLVLDKKRSDAGTHNTPRGNSNKGTHNTPGGNSNKRAKTNGNADTDNEDTAGANGDDSGTHHAD
ncbi:MAG: hypothetical protein SGARI_002924 [Bacillariaceae sp.]